MTGTAEVTTVRVTSPDGTPITAFVSGRGRPLVVTHGTTSDHSTWRMVVRLLEPHATVYAVDRRGRGASGDSSDYTLDREYADIAAVIDAAAAAGGGPVDVLGHSYGGNIAFGAAIRTANVRRLVLYEGWPVPNIVHRTADPRLMAEMESRLERGEPELMLETFYREMVKMSEPELATVRSGPTWPARVAAAHTVPREVRAFAAQAFDPAWAAKISVPVLLLVGSESPADIRADPEIVARALPDARIVVLEGQAHMAHLIDPESFAAAVVAFLSSGSRS